MLRKIRDLEETLQANELMM